MKITDYSTKTPVPVRELKIGDTFMLLGHLCLVIEKNDTEVAFFDFMKNELDFLLPQAQCPPVECEIKILG